MDIKLDEVYTIKISNGDEIVAKIVKDPVNADYYEIAKPLTVIPGPQGIQMIMSLFTANPDKNYRLNKNAVALIGLARDEVRDSYIEATTGIKPVSSKILMG